MKSRPAGKGKSKGPRSRAIKVDALARVEGEGGLFVKIEGDVRRAFLSFNANAPAFREEGLLHED